MSWLRELPVRTRLLPGPRASDELTDILTVCTGNICRAPYIAACLRARLPGLTISSAGTIAGAGASPLTRGLIRHARLIITAERIHRVRVIDIDPRAAGKTFTLKELARVASVGPPACGLDELIVRAARAALLPEDTDYDDNLDDPFGRGGPAFEKMVAEADAALDVVVAALAVRDEVPS